MSREYGLVSTTLSDKTWTFARGLPPLASAVRDAAASRKESLIGLEQLSRVAARSERAANLSARADLAIEIGAKDSEVFGTRLCTSAISQVFARTYKSFAIATIFLAS